MQGGYGPMAMPQQHHSHTSPFAMSGSSNIGASHANGGRYSENGGWGSALAQSRASATLWLGDLEAWMDESYVHRCVSAMRWDREPPNSENYQPVTVKMIRSASAVSGYCFLTFSTPSHASSVLDHFESTQQRTLMPNSQRTFKLNWATGLPGVMPSYQSEHSVFVGDLARDVTEAELVSLFTPLFPSTRAAKIMCDPRTGHSKGFGFVRFGHEADMDRALALGQSSASSGLSLRGRVIRISAATGSSGTGGPRRRHGGASGGDSGDKHAFGVLRTIGAVPGPPVSPGPQMVNDSMAAATRAVAAASATALLAGAQPLTPPPSATFSQYGQQQQGQLQQPQPQQIPQQQAPQQQQQQPAQQPAQSPTTPSVPTPQRAPSPMSQGIIDDPDLDMDNPVVFVGGLPAFIGEDTLRAMFGGFGEIVYVKVPPGKGCGFVQFVSRQEAETAILRMDGWPVHGKSRLRVTWGRSTVDRQVEHVRKLAQTLGVAFETVWDLAQGQSTATLKAIATQFATAGITVSDVRTSAEAIALAHLARAGALDPSGAVRAEWTITAQNAESPTVSTAPSPHPNGNANLPSSQPAASSASSAPSASSPTDSRYGNNVWSGGDSATSPTSANGSGGPGSAGGSSGPYARVPPSDFTPFTRPAAGSGGSIALGQPPKSYDRSRFVTSPTPGSGSDSSPAPPASSGNNADDAASASGKGGSASSWTPSSGHLTDSISRMSLGNNADTPTSPPAKTTSIANGSGGGAGSSGDSNSQRKEERRSVDGGQAAPSREGVWFH